MTDAATLSRKKGSRLAHRGSATKTVTKVNDELYKPDGPDSQHLRQYQLALQQKIQTLTTLDEQILELVEEDELEDEVDQADIVKEKIGFCLLNIEDALQRLAVTSSGKPPVKPLLTPPVVVKSTPPTPLADPGRPSSAPTPTVGGTHTTPTPHPLAPRVKLHIGGEATKWLPFWNQFETAIHDNPALTTVDKFNYLHSFLEYKAADAVGGMALTAANYPEAVTKLKKRFGNTQVIVDRHMEALLNLPSVHNHLDLEGLRRLVDKVETNIAGLRALGKDEPSYSGVVTSVVLGRLPSEIRLAVGKELREADRDVHRMMSIIDNEISAREIYTSTDVTTKSRRSIESPSTARKQPPTAATFLASNTTQTMCPFCDRDHPPENCTKVSSTSERANILRKYGRCYNCLKRRHLSKDCRSQGRCRHCRGKHHTALCRQTGTKGEPCSAQTSTRDSDATGKPSPVQKEGTQSQEGTRTSTNSLYAGSASPVLLQTAVMRVYNPNRVSEGYRVVRAVLDTGSQRTYLSEVVAKELHLTTRRSENLKIKAFGEADKTCPVVDLAIQTSNKENLKMEALIVPFICDPLSHQPTRRAMEKHEHLHDLELADLCSIDDRLQIDLLIGSDFYWSMVTGVIRRGRSGPTAIQTKVGWVLSGPTDVREVTTNLTFTSTHLLNVHCIAAEDKLEDRLKKFWTLGIQTQEQSVGDSFTQQIKFIPSQTSLETDTQTST